MQQTHSGHFSKHPFIWLTSVFTTFESISCVVFRRSCKARIGGPTCTSQSEPTLYLLSIAVYSMFNQCCQNILSETFKFIYLQTLSWTLGPFEIDPRESRRRKLKSCRWMRRPTAGFENTVK